MGPTDSGTSALGRPAAGRYGGGAGKGDEHKLGAAQARHENTGSKDYLDI